MTATNFTTDADELKRCEYSFHLSPALWNQYRGPRDLEWKCESFSRDALEAVPNLPGVYAFCVRPSIGGNLCGSYLLYVGKTNRSLRTRCREYLAKAEKDDERPKILRMMSIYFGTSYLHFCFAVVRETDPALIEEWLLEATVPPSCTAYPASVRSAVCAF